MSSLSDSTPLTVLVIEDDADTRANVCDILELHGSRPLTASSFAEALSRPVWSEVDAVLTDRQLPDGLAENWLPRIKECAPAIPVVVITGHPDVEGAIAALREGAYDYILKPINPDVLLASLGRITERRRIEKALRDREERLKAILEAAHDTILMVNKAGVVKSANLATQRMFGYSPDELVGQNVSLLFPQSHITFRPQFFQRSRDVGLDPSLVRDEVLTGRSKEGTTFPAEMSVSHIDHLESYSVIVRDVSERQEMQRQILEIAAEEDRRIGHELHDNIQQQLTGLSLLARSLADKLAAEYPSEAPRAKRLADEIGETARQVHFLARGLVPVEVDSQGLRASLLELAHKIADVHRIHCEFRCSDQIPVTDNFVATHLYRIAQESLNNALRHSRAKHILVTLHRDDDKIVLQVSDDGIGIAEQAAFHSGMGLRIMSYRAGLIGGQLEVKQREGGGTIVMCTIRNGQFTTC